MSSSTACRKKRAHHDPTPHVLLKAEEEEKEEEEKEKEKEEAGVESGGVILSDCSATEHTIEPLMEAARRGLRVVLANKKPLSAGISVFDELRSRPGLFRHEATVGAGLPVINTLDRQLNAGDTVHTIEGAFSGTLGFIFSGLQDGKLFSEVVREAKSAASGRIRSPPGSPGAKARRAMAAAEAAAEVRIRLFRSCRSLRNAPAVPFSLFSSSSFSSFSFSFSSSSSSSFYASSSVFLFHMSSMCFRYI